MLSRGGFALSYNEAILNAPPAGANLVQCKQRIGGAVHLLGRNCPFQRVPTLAII